MTSPARRTITSSPTRTPFLRTSNRLWNVAFDALVQRDTRQANAEEGIEQSDLRRLDLPADDCDESVVDEADRPLGGVPRDDLADDADGCIARIDEHLLVLRATFYELPLPLA